MTIFVHMISQKPYNMKQKEMYTAPQIEAIALQMEGSVAKLSPGAEWFGDEEKW